MRRLAVAAAVVLVTAGCGTGDEVHEWVGSPENPHSSVKAPPADPTAAAWFAALAERTTTARANRGTPRSRPPVPASPPRGTTGGGGDFWHRLANCESGGRLNPPGRYVGAFQFSPDTARTLGIDGTEDYETQRAAAERWSHMVNPSSTAGWPVCWKKAS